MNRVVFLSSILWASVSLGGVITAPNPPRDERYGIVEFPSNANLLESIQLRDKNSSVAYIDLLGTAKSMDLAKNRIVNGGVTGEYDMIASAPGTDLGNGFTRFDFRGLGIRNAAVAILHEGSAPAVSLNYFDKGIISSWYYGGNDPSLPDLPPGFPAIPIGYAYLGVWSETLDPPYGDANGDGRIDISDFGLLKDNFSANPGPYKDGDLNGDGWVQIDDFALLKQNFGWRQASAVPEPSTLGLLGVGMIFLILARKKRSWLPGQRFGSLVVLRFYGMYRRRTYWLCHCDCGRTTRVALGNLRGHPRGTKSCGCGLEANRPAAKPPEYRWWRQRVKHDTVFRDFEAFLSHVGERPSPKHNLRRPDPSKPFGPGNCEWSLLHSQAQLIEFEGLSLTMSEWAARLGISKQALSQRLAKYELDIALSPVRMKPGQPAVRKR